MKLDYKFTNLLGTVYKQGNIIFTPDGNSIISPVGNRVSVFDLVNNKSYTLPAQNLANITKIALHPSASLLLSVDRNGRCLLINFHRRVVLHQHSFKSAVGDIKFSPDGKLFAVAIGKMIQIWRTPSFSMEFAPFVLWKTFTGHYDDILTLNWSSDGKHLVSSGTDMCIKVWSVHAKKEDGYVVPSLSGHRDSILGVWFARGDDAIYSVARDGALFEWKHTRVVLAENNQESQENDNKKRRVESGIAVPEFRWKLHKKHLFMQHHAKITCCAYHSASNLLVAGFSNGVFGIYEMPEFINIHTLSISQKNIDTVSVNNTGEWIVLGSSKLGQLLVWEWKSESHILKQQGHVMDLNTLAYSQDSSYIVTGGEDGKIKLWSTASGFCFVTFSEHTAAVKAVEFAKQGQIIFSASLDGTVRAFDLIRYRNFRTFTTPTPVQLTCLAVDPSGEIVAAGSRDTFEIFIWNVQTGKLLEIFNGHQGPISSLSFSTNGFLASSSWDKSVRIWNVFGRDSEPEVFEHTHEVLYCTFRSDDLQLASSTLDGQVHLWNVLNGRLEKTIECRKDISGGRKIHDRTTAENSSSGKTFNTLCYTADGTGIIGGGNSKYICIYDVPSGSLLKKFTVTRNTDYDGLFEKLNSKHMTEAGPIEMIEMNDEEDKQETLPGVLKGDKSLRNVKPEIRCFSVRFSPTSRSWAASTTEGLMIYSLDEMITFDPYDLEIDVNESSVLELLQEKDYLKAFVFSIRLGEYPLTKHVFESITTQDVSLIARSIPIQYIPRLIKFLCTYSKEVTRVEYFMSWVNSIMKVNASTMKDNILEYESSIKALKKVVSDLHQDLGRMCDDNVYTIQYVMDRMKFSRGSSTMDAQDVTMELVGL